MGRDLEDRTDASRRGRHDIDAHRRTGPAGRSTLEVSVDPLRAGRGHHGRWFRRLPVSSEAREDAYLLTPWLDGLSVKIRADAEFDVKAYRGSPGVLEVPDRATGRMEAWQKWSFPLGVQSEVAGDDATWIRVRKVRRISWFVPPDGWSASPAGLDQRPRCAVELTDIVMGGEAWWTLGLEAGGPAAERGAAIEAAATSVFEEAMPGEMPLREEHSGPYAAWLRQRREAT